MKVLLSAFIGSNNLGDSAISEFMIRKLESIPNLKLSVLSTNVSNTENFKSRNETRIVNLSLRNFFSEIRICDVFVLGGGGLIQDASSVLSMIFYFLQIFLAKSLFHKKVLMLCVGIGPIETLFGSILLRWMSTMIDHSLVRDKDSKDLLLEHGFSENRISQAYDIVFNYAIKGVSSTSPFKRPYILFCPRDWFFHKAFIPVRYSLKIARKSKGSDLNVYRKTLLQLVEQILEKDKKMRIIAVPFFLSQDLDLLLWIRDHIQKSLIPRFVIVEEEISPKEYVDIAKKSEYIIGVRLHSLILGAIAGRPLVPLIYSDKVASFVKYMGATQYSTFLDKPNFQIEHVLSSCRKISKRVGKPSEYLKKIEFMRKVNDQKLREILERYLLGTEKLPL